MPEKITFGEIRQLLDGLGFVQIPAKKPAVIFEHKESDTLFFFRPHRLSDPADAMTVSVVRKFLDEEGLLDRADFEGALHQANGAAKGKAK